MIIVIKYVDSRSVLQAELRSQEELLLLGTQQRAQLIDYRQQAVRLTQELEQADQRAVTESDLANVQDEILALAKRHGCLPKKSSPRSNSIRDFNANRNSNTNLNTPGMDANNLLELHEVVLAINVEGDLKHTLEFLQAIKQRPWYASTSQLILRRDPTQESMMALEMDLTFSSLHRKKTPSLQLNESVSKT